MSSIEHHKAIWLSDIHLGSRACRIDLLLDFLQHNHSDVLYLVGDIIDLERLRRSVFWPASHTQALEVILEKSRNGTRVVYIPGNHDDDFRALAGNKLGNIEIALRAVHRTRSGRRLLVLHGDEFDTVLKTRSWRVLAGSFAYAALLGANRLAHWCNEQVGRPYWSLAQHVKLRLGNAVRYVENFRLSCLAAAKDADVDGIVCGHIHRAEIVRADGLIYYNDGDWVESCTALVEDQQGMLHLRSWTGAELPAADFALDMQDAA